MGCLLRSALFLVTESHSLTRSPNSFVLGESVEILDYLGWEIVEQAKSLNPSDNASYSACKYVKLIQDFLGYVRDTCPDIHKPGVSRSTKSSRSKSTNNTKNDRNLQISSSTQKKNKVENHSRIVKSCLNKPNCVAEPSGNANVQHSKLNKNYELIPTRRTFTLVGNACPLTRIAATNKVPIREPIPLEVIAQESVVTKVYTRRPKVVQIVLWYLDSGCSKHMTGDRSQLTSFVHKFLGTSSSVTTRLQRLWDLEVAFRKHTCFVRNLEGVDLLSGSRETKLYTLSIGDMMASFPICLLSKALKTKSWLWHRLLAHLNFNAINHLSKNDLVRGLPKLKFEKDHLKPNLSYLHIFGALCYPNNDSEDLGKLQDKVDIGIFIGYAPKKKAYRIYN
ncbi:integrase, catalytic region, zinc finger, CCHC-type containing protein [Tanacetum coccineum]